MKRGVIILSLLFLFGTSIGPEIRDGERVTQLSLKSISPDTVMIPFLTDLYAHSALQQFYRKRGFHKAWFLNQELTPHANSLLLALNNIQYFGLVGTDFKLCDLDSISRLPYSSATANMFEILLTDAFFRLADQLNAGRIDTETFRPRVRNLLPDSVLIAGLDIILNADRFRDGLKIFQPDHQHYHQLLRRLDNMLHQYFHGLLTNDERRFIEADMLKVAINIERWRWKRTKMPERYLLINIPAYTLKVYDNEKTVLESKVIVGTQGNATPIIQSTIQCFITYPYWHVPRSIATKELLPLIKRDPAYLSKNRFDVISSNGKVVDPSTIDWSSLNAGSFPYSLRQRAGTDNALGVLKFQFENRYAVYLHDTNAKKLFNTEGRAYSHGCIRVEKAYELAEYLIRYDSGKITVKTLDHYLNSRTQTEILLRRPLPILIEYFTADGSATYKDIYNKDRNLLALFEGMFPANTELPDYETRICYQPD